MIRRGIIILAMLVVCAATIYFGIIFSKPIVRATPTPRATPTAIPSVVVPMPSISVRTGPITPLPDISGVMRAETAAPSSTPTGVEPPKAPVAPIPPKAP